MPDHELTLVPRDDFSENLPEITSSILRNGHVQKYRLESIFRLHATESKIHGILQRRKFPHYRIDANRYGL